MPEFNMDTSGAVHVEWCDLDSFTQGYIEAAFFTSTDTQYDRDDWDSDECQEGLEQGTIDGTIPSDSGFSDIDPESLGAIIRDCRVFQQLYSELLALAYERDDYDATQAGRDYWYTRNGHGVGYWDRSQLDSDGLGEKLTNASEYHSINLFWISEPRGRVVFE